MDGAASNPLKEVFAEILPTIKWHLGRSRAPDRGRRPEGQVKGSRWCFLGGIVLLLIGLALVGSDAQVACHKALVVIDVQKLYLSRATWLTSDGKDLVAKIEPLLKAARENGIPVIYVQHVNNQGLPATSSLVAFADAIAPRVSSFVLVFTVGGC